jgi:hypothetical protein
MRCTKHVFDVWMHSTSWPGIRLPCNMRDVLNISLMCEHIQPLNRHGSSSQIRAVSSIYMFVECIQPLSRHTMSIRNQRCVEPCLFDVLMCSTFELAYDFHPTWEMDSSCLWLVNAFNLWPGIWLPSNTRDVFRICLICERIGLLNRHRISIQHGRCMRICSTSEPP